MSRFRLASALLAATALSGLAAPAFAQVYPTWTQKSDWTPVGPISACSGADCALGPQGWLDHTGSKWSVDASNNLQAPAGATGGGNVSSLVRPTGENATNERCQVKLTLSSGTNNFFCGFRLSGASGSLTGYFIGIVYSGSQPQFNYAEDNAGTVTAINGQANVNITGASENTAYIFKAWVVQTAATTTTLCAEIDTTGGTLVFSNCITDPNTIPALQGASGQISLSVGTTYASGAVPVTEVTTFTAPAPTTANTYALTGPSSGATGAASTNFTVQSNGTLASSVTVTPSLSGVPAGTISPTSLTLAAGNYTSATFTYTPASAGTETINTATNTGGLTSSPASLSYQATSPNTIATNSPAFRWSPGNWSCVGTRSCLASDVGGYPQTWNTGAYFTVNWNAAASSPTASIVFPTNTHAPSVSCEVNGVMYDNLSANGPLSLNGLSPNPIVANNNNTATCFVARMQDTSTRWNGVENIQVQGLQVDGGSSAGTATGPCGAATCPWVLFEGDSVQEGRLADSGGTVNDFMVSYTFLVMQDLFAQGYDVGTTAGAGTGYVTNGDGGVPMLYDYSAGPLSLTSRWWQIDQNVSMLDSNNMISGWGGLNQQPSLIFYNTGGNDATTGPTANNFKTSIQGLWASWHAAAPNAKLLFVPAFSLQIQSLHANGATIIGYFNADMPSYVNMVSVKYNLVNTVTNSPLYFVFGASDHPLAAGHAMYAPTIDKIINGALQPPDPWLALALHWRTIH